MPRRHPKQEDNHRGPNPVALAARRERRQARRDAKSRPLPYGLLTDEERTHLVDERRLLRALRKRGQLGPEAAEQLRNIERELKADVAASRNARSKQGLAA